MNYKVRVDGNHKEICAEFIRLGGNYPPYGGDTDSFENCFHLFLSFFGSDASLWITGTFYGETAEQYFKNHPNKEITFEELQLL